jgi:hypothetical protein
MPAPAARLEIRCPRCAGRAGFEEAFEFISARTRGAAEEGLHRWGGWLVRERYPSVMRWKAPAGPDQYLYRGRDRLSGGYRLMHRGVVRCTACHHVGVHRLRWPADAWFRWTVRGTPLWAWDAEHARVLLAYVENLRREPRRHPRYRGSLQKLPAVVLAARNRTLVAGKIRASLQAAGEPTA